MKNGSRKSSKTPSGDIDDVTDAALIRHREAPKGERRDGHHLNALKPIPKEAHDKPIEWAEKHIESLAPHAAKELEWALKFGSDHARREVARDLLAMKGITTKPKESGLPTQAVVLNLGLPAAPNGAPALPFSNAPRALDSATVDGEVVTEPAKKGTA